MLKVEKEKEISRSVNHKFCMDKKFSNACGSVKIQRLSLFLSSNVLIGLEIAFI